MIAEFMGLKPLASDPSNFFLDPITNSYIYTKTMSYSSSWEWLMPVVNKIKSIDDSFTILEVGIYDIVENDEIPEISHYEYDICDTYSAVVKFIEWYNENILVINYPFNEGDDYYMIDNRLVIESCWDKQSEELYKKTDVYYATLKEAIFAYKLMKCSEAFTKAFEFIDNLEPADKLQLATKINFMIWHDQFSLEPELSLMK